MDISLKEYLDEMKLGIHARQDAQATIIDEVVLPKLNNIEDHVKLTNGRVTTLETQTIFIRWVGRNAKLGAAIFIGSIIIIDILTEGLSLMDLINLF